MTIVIVGGGWSGLAAAITLTQQGHSVHLIESAKQLGGRARNVQWHKKTIDNGQHLMIGAYEHMLTMMKLINVDQTAAFDRIPLDINVLDTHFPTLRLSASGHLPWPLSLAWNFTRSAGFSGLLQVNRLQKNIDTLLSSNDISVSEWLQTNKQSARLTKQLWEPLCLATLNTPIQQASAQVFAKVLQDSLGQGKSAADLLIPKQPLGDLFPHKAAEFILKHGGKISLQTRVTDLVINQNKLTGITTNADRHIVCDNVIIATNPTQTVDLISTFMAVNLVEQYPIATVYLQYPEDCRLPQPLLGLTGTTSQWIFDRSTQHPGLMAVVISAPGKHENLSKEQLVQQISKEVHQQLPSMPVQALDSLVIREKRATFACTVDSTKHRPESKTAIQGLWLAGDYIANKYPATLEGAIRNGENCAQQLISAVDIPN